ncbi:tetratricopeptide repeat protein [bacterium]|nr:tetratricopeptide repeat protein [bacterium]
MHKIKQLGIVAGVLLVLTAIFLLNGCTPPAPKELTPEQRQAIQDSLMKQKTDSLNLLWSLGYEHYKQKNYGNAKKYFRQIAFMDFMGLNDRRLQKVYQYLGTCYIQMEPADWDSAEWSYIRGTEQLPDYPYNFEMLGYIYKTRGEIQKAIDMYSILTGLVPDTSLYWVELGDMQIADGNCEDGIASFREAVALEPKNPDIHEKLSEHMKDCGIDTDQIIESLKILVNQDPGNVRHRVDLAKNYMDIGEYREAASNLEVAISNEPENIQALDLSGRCYLETGPYSKAVDAFTKIQTLKPDDKNNLCNLAMAYTAQGQYASAMSHVRKALALDPDYGLTYITRGLIYETAADKCAEAKNNKLSFSDKLVYELAYNEYVKATRDLSKKQEANQRIGYVKPLLPTKADLFMHRNETISGPCYEWIQ